MDSYILHQEKRNASEYSAIKDNLRPVCATLALQDLHLIDWAMQRNGCQNSSRERLARAHQRALHLSRMPHRRRSDRIMYFKLLNIAEGQDLPTSLFLGLNFRASSEAYSFKVVGGILRMSVFAADTHILRSCHATPLTCSFYASIGLDLKRIIRD